MLAVDLYQPPKFMTLLPIHVCEGCDGVWRGHERGPGIAAGIHNIFVGLVDAVGVLAQIFSAGLSSGE